MAIKLLISGEANSGKTTLTEPLTDALVVSHDGKSYALAKPHVNVPKFSSVDELIDLIAEKIEAYAEKFGEYPKLIVFDSVSKIFDTINDYCNTKFTGFNIYTQLNKDVSTFNTFVQEDIVENGVDVIIISHALYDAETSRYNLVGKGDFQKRGGFLSEVEEAVFLEVKNGKRNVHIRSTKFPARTLLKTEDDSTPVDKFNLQEYVKLLRDNADKASEFSL